MNSYILDFNFLKEQDINISEFLTLLKISDNNIPFDYKQIYSLQDKGFIKIIKSENYIEEYIIREKGKLLLELITIDESIVNSKPINKKKLSNRVINSDIDKFVEEYRSCWKGLKVGSMGSLQACKDKLYRWMKNNPQYNKEDILRAAKIYIRSVDDLKYLQQADYFIYKQDKNGTETSRLSALIDEIEQPTEGWTSKIN